MPDFRPRVQNGPTVMQLERPAHQSESALLAAAQIRAASQKSGLESRINELLALIDSDVFTPVLTPRANVTDAVAYECQYMKVGNVVTAAGALDIQPTAGAVETMVGISLPLASGFIGIEQCGGSANALGVVASGGILADVAEEEAMLNFIAPDASLRTWSFSFTYLIVG